MRLKKDNGFTLIELIIVVGVMALAAASVYGLASIASDWRKSSAETQKLLILMRELDSATNITGSLAGIDMTNLSNISGGMDSSLDLKSITSVGTDKLEFSYKDVNPRVCNDMGGKLLASANNIELKVNGINILHAEDVSGLGVACSQNRNDLTIVMSKLNQNYTMTLSNPVVNVPLPPPAPPVPMTNHPMPLVVPQFVASVANPIVYGLSEGAGQIPPPINNPPLSVTPSPPSNPSSPPPLFVPPVVVEPPPPTSPGDTGGTPGATDPWSCPVTTCSVALYVESDAGQNYFGLSMMAMTPSIAARSWLAGPNPELKEDVTPNIVVRPSAPGSYTNAGFTHNFNYGNLRQALTTGLVSEPLSGAVKSAAEAIVGTVIIDSMGVKYEVGSIEREVYSSVLYDDPNLRGVIYFLFMRRIP